MADERLEGLQHELDGWRARLDHLRLKANLGRMELRDRLEELGDVLAPAHRRAKRVLGEAASAGSEEVQRLVLSLQAGWEELVRAHREASSEAARERSAAHAKKRNS